MKRIALIAAAVIGTVLFYAGTASGGIHPSWTCLPDDYIESECGPTTVPTTSTTVVINTVVAPTTTTTEVTTSSTTSAPTTTTTVEPTTTSTSAPTSTSTSVAPTTTTSSPPSTTATPTTSTTPPSTSSTTSTSEVQSTSTTTAPTTSTTTTSTTTLPETFTFGAAGTVCVREVPTIRITFQNLFPSLAGRPGTLTMRNVNGIVVGTESIPYEPGTTVDVLYPGTHVNPDGSVADVPGWTLNSDGFWVLDPSDAILREGIFLTYEVNPTAGPVLVSYPPESSECANPSGPFPPVPVVLVPGQLPPTA